MESNKQAFIFSFVLSLALFSSVLCIVADFKRSKSPAFGFGVAALTCLVAAQIIGNILALTCCSTTSNNGLCCFFRSKDAVYDDAEGSSEDDRRSIFIRKPTIAAACLMVISWLSFGTALVLISVATSMNKVQAYGEGWLDGECYLVRNGVFTSVSVLVLISISSILGSAVLMKRHRQEQNRNVSLKSGI